MPDDPPHLVIFGLGYTGRAIAASAVAAGFAVVGTSRNPTSAPKAPQGVTCIDFAVAEATLATATHLLTTAPPDEAGDPVLARYASEIAAARRLRWIGYLSTTGVYGDHG